MPHHSRTATSLTRDRLANAFGSTPFTHADLAAIGISRGQLRAAQAQGYVTSVNRGLFAVQGSASQESAADAARRALKSLDGVQAVIAGRVAGQLHSTPMITPRSAGFQHSVTEVMVLKNSLTHFGRRTSNILVRPVAEFPDDVVEIDGIPTTGRLHTAIDLVRMGLRPANATRARSLALPEALVILDATTRNLGDLTPGEAALRLQGLRPRFRQAQGIRAVDTAIHFVDPRSETPLESWSRGHMIVHGIPLPMLQQVLLGADGQSYRVDFCWPEARLIGEADGLAKYGDDPQSFRRAKAEEIHRQRALEKDNWRFVRWTWDDMARRPLEVMRELSRALANSPLAA